MLFVADIGGGIDHHHTGGCTGIVMVGKRTLAFVGGFDGVYVGHPYMDE